MVGSALAVPPALAEPAEPGRLTAQVEKLDNHGGEVAGRGWASPQRPEVKLAEPVWPVGGTRLRTSMKKQTAQVSVSAEVVDRAKVPAKWRAGVVARVSAATTGAATTGAATTGAATTGAGATGTASVTVDYSTFRNAYGGGWASRLRAYRLPECALTTPSAFGCSATPLPSANDSASQSVTAEVPVGKSSALVALAAGASGDSGDFAATPLSASSTWSAGGSTGGFSWSYPVRTPPGIAGPQPSVSLGYSSASADGRSSASNNQPSWIGEGFGYSPGFIERRYVPCEDDDTGSANNPKDSADLCWRSDNATMSLGDSSTELVYQEGKGWHGRSKDGSKVEKLTGAANGDASGEYWKVTGSDGMQYFFGRDDLPGQTLPTNSAWTVPVYGNHANEPGHDDTFSASREVQAWRWNLDYAIDVHGNTLSLWYSKETNKYGAEVTETKLVPYDRGGTLNRIDYGTWDRGATERSVKPLAQVWFDTDDRCLSGCTDKDADHWPDTPWDQDCAAETAKCDNFAPSFWSTKRLAKIRTRVWDTTKAVADWQDVDSITLSHSFPSPGDGQKGGLWLDSIVRTGHVGGTVVMPPVTFDPVAKQNRVLTKHNTTNNWQRLAAVRSETGAITQVTYSEPECTASNLPASPHTNTKLCYPVIGPDPNSTSGGDITEYWHKYVVRQVTQTDVQLADGHQSPTVNTRYTYEGTPAWHYADDDGLGKPKYKTWNQFRGYAAVSTSVGDTNPTLTRTTFLRGMHLDRAAPAGGTRTVTVPASLGDETVYDEDEYAGMVRESVTYNGTEDKPLSKTVNVPWRSSAKASRTINGDTVTARFTGTKTVYKGTALGTDGSRGWRVSRQHSSFDDDYALADWVQDDGDTTVTGDEKCTTTAYNQNTDKNILTLVKRATITTLACGTAPTSPDHVVSDTRTFYDGATSADTVVTKGLASRVDAMTNWTAAAGTTWLTTVKAVFDDFGRQKSGTDTVRGNTTTTTYSPADSLPTLKTETTQQGWVSTTGLYPYWGVPGKITDPNGRVTEGTYDPLGRTWKLWDPGWTRADHPNEPLTTFTYYFDPTRKSYPHVKTEALNTGGTIETSYQIFDGLLRERQTQKRAIGGGRIVSDTIYDSYGRVEMTFAAHAEPGNVSGTMWWEPEWSVPAQQVMVYDRASRATDKIFKSGDGVTNIVEKWRTKTTYEGDRTTVVPPRGGTPTTTLTDINGRTVEARQYTTASGTAGAYEATKYSYNAKELLAKVVDGPGDEWTYKYDIRGRPIESKDPDKGTSYSEYNDAGDLTKTTDARGEVLVHKYDALGRKVATYDDAIADANKRTELKYDTMSDGGVLKGQLTEAIRYDNGAAYTWQALGINQRYQVTGERYLIPAAETGLAGSYPYSHQYSSYTGAKTAVSLPAAGDLPAELLTTKYDATTGLPTSLTSGWSDVGTYVAGQQYSAYGEPTVTTLKNAGGVFVEQSISYELDTRRVAQVQVKPENANSVVNRTYGYAPYGGIEWVNDSPQTGTAETQCFSYDYLQRLTSAWTPKTDVAAVTACQRAKSVANLGGPAPYWQDWTIDRIGNRTKEVSHVAAGQLTRDYTVPTPGPNVVRPHAVTSMKTTQPGQTTGTTVSFGYDNTGNMTTRPGPTNGQVLTWDVENKLVKIVEGAKTTTNLYDPSGNRLLRRDDTGTTLYLPGQEVRRTSSGVSGTRYYNFAGATVASRTFGARKLTWLFSDHQGTQQLSMNASTLAVTLRRQNPYGEARGTSPLWPNGKGFVGGDVDPTGLIHMGARQYDSALGRFISVDPVQDLTDPQQWNGYAYANNSPVTYSDPSGLDPCPGGGGGCGYDDTPEHVQDPGACTTSNTCEHKQEIINGGDGSAPGSGGNPGGSDSSSSPGRNNNTGNSRNAGCSSIDGCGPDYEQIERVRAAMIRLMEAEEPDARTKLGGYCRMQVSRCAAYLIDLKNGAEPWHIAGQILCSELDTSCRENYGIVDMMSGPSLGTALNPDVGDAVLLAVVSGGSGVALRVMKTAIGGNRQTQNSVKECLYQDSKNFLNSFDPGTPVLMADGTTKPIRDVQVGDLVLATDPKTGKSGAREVTDLHNNLDDNLIDVLISGPDGSIRTLHTTTEHPFWDETSGRWVDAAQLVPGHELFTPSRAAAVFALQDVPGSKYMVNLTVQDLQTYYVLVGDTPILVHNCGSSPFYRGSKAGPPSFAPRAGEYKVNPDTGFVKDTHGVSVFDNAGSVSKKGFEPHGIDMDTVPDTLRVIQRGNDLRHFEIVPRPGANLTPERYADELSKIRCLCEKGK